MKSKNLPLLLVHCIKVSRIKYENYLEEQRKAKSSNKKALKCKAIQESIDVVRKKKTFLESTVSELVKDADRFSLETENAKNMEEMKLLLSKSLFGKTTNKQGEMKECEKQTK